MLPREAIRPLLRRALAFGDARPEVGGHGMVSGDSPDPLDALVRHCEALLPLPPFEVWVEDATVHPEAHLADLQESPDAPTADDPVTLDARPVRYRTDPWVAHLRAFRDGAVWRGYITFEQRPTGRLCRTSLIFREHDPAELRARFGSFDDEALEAFLRSSLP